MLEIIQERGCFQMANGKWQMAKGICFIIVCIALGIGRRIARG